MTITANDTRNEYTATAGQTVFTYTFKIFEDTDIVAYVTPAGQAADDTTDLETVLSVTGVGDEAGGTVTLAPVALNSLVTLVSAIPETRTTDYQNNGDFLPVTVNADFDRVVSLVKQAIEKVERGVVVQDSQQGTSPLVFPSPEADKVLGWKSTLDALENKTVQGTVIADGSVTLANLADLTTKRAIGRNTALTGVPEEVTIEQMLNWFTSIAQGDILFRGAAGFERLGAGTADYFLQTKGVAANPVWTSIPNATDAIRGIIEILTDAEAATGTDTTRALTAANLNSIIGHAVLTAGTNVIAGAGVNEGDSTVNYLGTHSAASWKDIYSVRVQASGTVTTAYIWESSASIGRLKLYKNGVASGTEHTFNGTTGIDTDDTVVAKGDVLSVRLFHDGGGIAKLGGVKLMCNEESFSSGAWYPSF